MASLVSKKAIDWRGRGLWNLKKEEITRVLLKPVEQTGFALVLEGEGPQSQIKLAEDVQTAPGFRFGVSEAKRLVDALPSLRAVAFVDEPKKDDEMGFGGAHTQVVVEKKEGKSLTLHIGSENDKNQVYVKVADKEQVSVNQSSVQKFKGGLDALRHGLGGFRRYRPPVKSSSEKTNRGRKKRGGVGDHVAQKVARRIRV